MLETNESARLQKLRKYEILDSAPEEEFDRFVRLAGSIFETPIALISFVDETRQWFKARIGLEASETPREIAFCDHAIRQDDVFVVPNATEDDRFSANPLVLSDPHVRFYAGAPLVTADGNRLGTLCVIDRRTRQPNPTQLKLLKDLAGLVVDQLELRQAHRAEETLRLTAETASRSKSQFLSRMSHEIRTPLTAIIGYADLLLMGLAGPHTEYAGYIRESGTDLLEIINDILDLEKLTSGKLSRRPQEFDINQKLEKIRRLFGNMAQRKGLDFTVTLEQSPAAPMSFIADPVSLRQILVNLVGNALKFTQHGSVSVRARIVPASTGQHTFICDVEDTGPGIAHADLERIFEPFEQIDGSSTRTMGGTGLGLPIARQLAEALGGTVTARSVVDCGATFTLALPLTEADCRAGTQTIDEPDKDKSQPLRGVRILLPRTAIRSRVWSTKSFSAGGAT